MNKILNRTKGEWFLAIKESIEQKQRAIADARAILRQERLASI